MPTAGSYCITIPNKYAGQRLDVTLRYLLPELSRSSIVQLIRHQNVRIEQLELKPNYRLKGGERVEVILSTVSEPTALAPQPIALNIIHEDEDIIVVDKASGMVVHPAPGNCQNTLVNALLYRFPELNKVGMIDRPGIVHRLDKDTSGVMVIAKNQFSLTHLAAQFQHRTVEKKYLAIVWGVPKKSEGEISYPIGRHPIDRKKMSINSRKGRHALTLWQVKAHYSGMTLLELEIKTGRTHQIRVHCAAINHPIVGDAVYGKQNKVELRSDITQDIATRIARVKRQMLHAWQLSIIHPRTQESMLFKAPIPSDMAALAQIFNYCGLSQE